MKLATPALTIYATIIAVFITAGSFAQAIHSGNPVFLILFLPVILHFFLAFTKPNKGHKIVLYYDFILTSIMAISGFLGAKNTPELISALMFVPLSIYFWLLVIPTTKTAIHISLEKTEEKQSSEKHNEVEGELDPDRRTFLKIAGSVGLGVFFLSVFSKRFENNILNGKLYGLSGSKGLQSGNPGSKTDVSGYEISEIDDANPTYFGFIDKDGKWYIMKETDSGSFRYARGQNNFSVNWATRDKLSYGYYNKIF